MNFTTFKNDSNNSYEQIRKKELQLEFLKARKTSSIQIINYFNH